MAADVSQLEELADRAAKLGGRVRRVTAKEVATATRDLVAESQSRAPVRTGALRDSIQGSARGLRGEVSSDLEYSAYVEFGTAHHGGPQPYLNPAADQVEQSFENGVEKAVEKLLGTL